MFSVLAFRMFSCNILGMFYRRTFYNMLPHQHPQNIPRMLQLKLSSFVNISHYKNVLERFSGIVGLNNILKTFSACRFDNVLPLLSSNIVGKFYKKCSVTGGLKKHAKNIF